MQYRRISSPAACARSSSPGLRALNRMMGCILPSPAWKILLMVRPYFSRDFADVAQRGRNLRARHHAILHVIGRAHAAHRAEGVLAALPQQLALFGRSAPRETSRAPQRSQTSRICSVCSSTASRSPSSSISSTAAASIG